MIRNSSPFTLLLVGAMGCGGPSDGEIWQGELEQRDGMVIVRNPPDPVHDSFHVTAIWSRTEENWQEIIDVEADGDLVFLLDRMASQVYVLDRSDGGPLQEFGRSGQGPGEFQRAHAFDVRDGEVLVVDGGNAELDRFTSDGEYLGSISPGGLAFGAAWTAGDTIRVNRLRGRDRGWVAIAANGDVHPFQLEAWQPEGEAQDSTCVRAEVMWDRVVQLTCGRLSYREMSFHGEVSRVVIVEKDPQPIDENALEEHLAHVRTVLQESGFDTQLIQQQVAREEKRLRANPRFRALKRDDVRGWYLVWEQPPDGLGQAPSTIHVFDSEGVWLSSHDFERPWADFAVRDGRLYSLEIEETTGLKELVAYELGVPQGAGGATNGNIR